MSYNEEQPSAPPPRTVSLHPTSPTPPDKALPPLPQGTKKENKLFTYLLRKPGISRLCDLYYVRNRNDMHLLEFKDTHVL